MRKMAPSSGEYTIGLVITLTHSYSIFVLRLKRRPSSLSPAGLSATPSAQQQTPWAVVSIPGRHQLKDQKLPTYTEGHEDVEGCEGGLVCGTKIRQLFIMWGRKLD